ncbi:MAG: 50S ribosomal protein L3 [Planctomycetota bacterium]|jgi:large subunit ribosomal protein L3
MAAALLGRKLGMTRFFTEDGGNLPVTVIEAGPCTVSQVKTTETDGYAAIQISYGDVKPRNSTMPIIGHDAAAGTAPRRTHRELRLENDADAEAYSLGDTITLEDLADAKFVDVTGTSKGKGFAGGMKRYGFKGQLASHGVQRKHRSPGSIGGHSSNLGTGPKLKKGKRMAGHMGDERVTARSMDVVKIDRENNLLLVKGSVPGASNGTVFIRAAVRLNRKKASAAAKA